MSTIKYPMGITRLYIAMKEFSKLLSKRDPSAKVDLRYGYQDGEYIIDVRWALRNQCSWILNANTGAWWVNYYA